MAHEVAVTVDGSNVHRLHATQIATGSLFVPHLRIGALEDCRLTLACGGYSLQLAARSVLSTPDGTALSFAVPTGGPGATFAALVAEIAKLADAPMPTTAGIQDALSTANTHKPETEDEPSAPAAAPGLDAAPSLRHQLRNLPPIEQAKRARKAELAERILLERMYGKGVWEALLANPRVTPPEVARIARMGTISLPVLERIYQTEAWLQSPEVRRALLSNPKLPASAATRVLGHLPAHELRLVPKQTAYSSVVRDAAQRLLKNR